MNIMDEIKAERDRQIAKGFDAAHDDQHVDRDIVGSADWGAGQRLYAAYMTKDPATYREELVKVSAMILAEIERHDREYQGEQS